MNTIKKGSRILLIWNREDLEDVEKARSFFMNLTKQGWFAAKRDSELRRVLDFKPEYEELWFIPISEGG